MDEEANLDSLKEGTDFVVGNGNFIFVVCVRISVLKFYCMMLCMLLCMTLCMT